MSPSLSFWMDHFSFQPREPLRKNLDADICIIGAGIVGLTCAYILSQAGKKVIVLESDNLGKNQTALTTGHLTNVLDDRYCELEKLFGIEGSQLAASSHAAAINLIEQISKKENIPCRFERVDAYLFVPPNESVDILYNEYEASKRAGLDVSIVDRTPLEFDTGMALHFRNQGQFSPLPYLQGLALGIEKYNGSIYCNTKVQKVIGGEGVKLKTEQGYEVNAKAAIVATNVPINDRVLIHTKQAAYRSYVIAGKIPSQSIFRALYYDTPDPYHYIRLATDPKTGDDWLIVGGEDHRTGEEKNPAAKYAVLEKWARERFPQLGTISYKWSGQIIEPVDSLAYIGKNPMDINVYVATGDSGNGLTHATLGALLIADLIQNKKNAWEKLYSPSRINLKAASEYLKENLNTLGQYGDWLYPSDVKSEEEISPNSGAIIQRGMQKVACYRRQDGSLKYLSATCPHLEGVVRWNNAEKSWDCPCHGSRFSAEGKKINGPANGDLKEIETK
jgi:glycine/D-amino acid oxidase-like deaminating enzyme/nitrite reductase/ring-hydroxylating ferredoxin subunit